MWRTIMFSAANFHVTRGSRSRCRSFFGIVSQPTKEPLKRGVFFGVLAGVLIITGTVVTYLGFSNAFNKRLSTVGPLLIGLSLLLLLFAVRQLVQYRKLQQSTSEDCQLGRSSVATMVIERDAEGTVTVVMDMINPDTDSVGRLEQADVEVVSPHPPSYNEAVENSGTVDDWMNVPEGDPPPSYDEALQDSEPSSNVSTPVSPTNEVSEAWSSIRNRPKTEPVTG